MSHLTRIIGYGNKVGSDYSIKSLRARRLGRNDPGAQPTQNLCLIAEIIRAFLLAAADAAASTAGDLDQ